VFTDVDWLAAGETPLHLFGHHGGGAEAPYKLESRLAQMLGATLIRHDRTYNIAIPGDDAASVHIG
jgi:hypothetical protein